jgi:hypothetical protein
MAFRQLAAGILAAVFLITAFVVPSWGHEGHIHHLAHAAKSADPTSDVHPHQQGVTSVAMPSTQGILHPGTVGDLTTCAGHCCGSSAGMTCCGAALAPDAFWVQPFRSSAPLLLPSVLPPSGLSPEALPKPPKSFA